MTLARAIVERLGEGQTFSRKWKWKNLKRSWFASVWSRSVPFGSVQRWPLSEAIFLPGVLPHLPHPSLDLHFRYLGVRW
jgi:hypothetical protein